MGAAFLQSRNFAHFFTHTNLLVLKLLGSSLTAPDVSIDTKFGLLKSYGPVPLHKFLFVAGSLVCLEVAGAPPPPPQIRRFALAAAEGEGRRHQCRGWLRILPAAQLKNISGIREMGSLDRCPSDIQLKYSFEI